MWNAFDAQDVTLEDFLAISVNKPNVLSDSFWNDLHSFIERLAVIDEVFPFTRGSRSFGRKLGRCTVLNGMPGMRASSKSDM